ncbi:MAG: TetR/AcrR family transcriptional regulator [Myxococcota bacterium]
MSKPKPCEVNAPSSGQAGGSKTKTAKRCGALIHRHQPGDTSNPSLTPRLHLATPSVALHNMAVHDGMAIHGLGSTAQTGPEQQQQHHHHNRGRQSMSPKQSRRQETEARLIRAVGDLMARDGFDALGVNAIAREAGVDKVLIYRYFDGLNGLYRAYGEQADFWPDLAEFLAPGPDALFALPPAEAGAQILTNYARAIQRRPRTLELLAWEMTQRNALTIALEEVRERRSDELGQLLAQRGFPLSREVMLMVVMVSAGINYLSTRRRSIRIFSGINIRDDATWDDLHHVLVTLFTALLPPTEPP